jgi:hypothetical protein
VLLLLTSEAERTLRNWQGSCRISRPPEALHRTSQSYYDFVHDGQSKYFRITFGQAIIMSTVPEWAHAFMSPSPVALVIAVLLVLTIPLFLHSVVFRASGLTTLPSILLIGPSGSGKTSMLTLVRPLILQIQNAPPYREVFKCEPSANKHPSSNVVINLPRLEPLNLPSQSNVISQLAQPPLQTSIAPPPTPPTSLIKSSS